MSDLYFLKFVARDSIQRTHVIFCCLANKAKNTIEKFEVLVSYSPDIINIGNDFTYKDIVTKIQKFMLEGNYVQNATLSLTNTFKTAFTAESYLMEYIYYLEYENSEKLNELIKQNLVKILGKNDMFINVIHNSVTREDLEKSSHDIEAPVGDTLESVQNADSGIIPAGSMVTNFTFLLSPVNGTKVDELKVGDKVLIKLTADNDISSNIINLLSLKEESGIIKPAPATIVDLKKHSGEIATIVKITDGIFAKYTELEIDVKVKLAGNETLSAKSRNAEEFEIKDHHSKQNSNSINLNTILIAGVIGLLIVSWILISVFL